MDVVWPHGFKRNRFETSLSASVNGAIEVPLFVSDGTCKPLYVAFLPGTVLI